MPWTLAYANTASGGTVEGDRKALIRAVRNGSSVKVVLEYPDSYFYSFQAHTVRVRNDHVYAVNTLDVSSDFVGGDDLRFIEDSYYYMLIASTKGVLEQIRWNVGEHVMRKHDQGVAAMRWFVD